MKSGYAVIQLYCVKYISFLIPIDKLGILCYLKPDKGIKRSELP